MEMEFNVHDIRNRLFSVTDDTKETDRECAILATLAVAERLEIVAEQLNLVVGKLDTIGFAIHQLTPEED